MPVFLVSWGSLSGLTAIGESSPILSVAPPVRPYVFMYLSLI